MSVRKKAKAHKAASTPKSHCRKESCRARSSHQAADIDHGAETRSPTPAARTQGKK